MKRSESHRIRQQFVWIFVPAFLILGIQLHPHDQHDLEENDYPWLSTLKLGDWANTFKSNKQVVQTGRPLFKLPYGLHSLEQGQESNTTVLIGIHGFKARGYEWVYPLLVMDNESIHTHFFRWDFYDKNDKARKLLLEDLDEMIEHRTEPLERIVIVAHSCGGVMVASAINDLPKDVKIDLHTVASPLNGLGWFTVCKAKLPESLPENMTFTQWRTAKVKDSVFWWFPRDPQKIQLDYSEVVQLPKKYNGIRLGHVRS